MAQLTNKWTDEDLDYYIQEWGDVLAIGNQIKNREDPKQILHFAITELIKFKKLNQEP